jgi:membrane-bound ClpP family serine protease
MFIMFGLPIILGAILLIVNFSLNDVQSSNTQIAMLYITGAILCTNPAATALLTQYILLSERTVGTFSYTLANGDTVTLISPWIPFTILYLILTAVFLVLTVFRVRRVED